MVDVYADALKVQSSGVELTVAVHGPSDGPAVLMIHGFPDSARLWRNQVPALADAGYRVLAPDLRGYGRSDKPADIEDYHITKLAADMLAVLDAVEVDRAQVVGHDWGAAVAWYLAIAHPDRVRSLTALSVGHPTSFREAGNRQLEKSWYMLLFQFEGVAEEWLSGKDWQGLRRWMGSHPEVENWIADLSRPGALTAALNTYRANMGPERLIKPPPSLPPVRVPVMGVWSSRDGALLEPQMLGSSEYVEAEWRYERIDDVSHWIPLDAPEQLNGLLLDWLHQH
ncbi:MAG: alpha/beta fold hydrolase [Actinomycetota bacterium]